jgi:release factor glutamine methyltransferase
MDPKFLELSLRNGVYEPREDSYLLAKAVGEYAFGKVLDLGTGTGIQGITAALKGCEVTFADVDRGALECAKMNAELNRVDGTFVRSDLFGGIKGKFNTIIFNPPYLESKKVKDLALDGGLSGRVLIDRFLKDYKKHLLAKHAVLLLESSINGYEKDVKRLGAKIVGKEHYFFEDLVVLLFR